MVNENGANVYWNLLQAIYQSKMVGNNILTIIEVVTDELQKVNVTSLRAQ